GGPMTAAVVLEAEPAPQRCAHCELPVPPGLVDAEAAEQFCCAGCRSVFALLRQAHLDSLHAHRASSGRQAPGPAEAAPAGAYAEFDDASFSREHVAGIADTAAARCQLYLEGVHCAACVWLIERLPRLVPGVEAARLDLGSSVVILRFRPDE